MVKSQGVLSNLSWLYTAEFFIRIGSFLLVVLLARYLGDYNLGVYSYAFAFCGLLMSFFDFGVLTYLVKEVAKDKSKTERLFDNIATIKFLFNAVALIMIIIFAIFVNKSSESKIVILAGIALFFNFSGYTFKAIFQAYEGMKYIAIAQIIERVIAISLGALFLIKGYSLTWFVSALIISYFTFFAYLYIKSRKIVQFHFRFDIDSWKKVIKLSLPFWFTEIFFTIYTKIDSIILPFLKNFQVTGWYSAAYKIIEGLTFIPILASIVLFPAMSRLFKNDKNKLKILYNKSFYYLFVIVLPIVITIFMLSDRIILFFYGKEFTNSIYALQILIILALFLFLNYVMGYLLNAIDKQKFFTYTAGIGAILNITLDIILIPLFDEGYQGAAIGAVLTQIFNFLILYYLTCKNGFRINLWDIAKKPFFAVLLMAVSIYFIRQFHLILIVLAAAIIYFIALYLVKGIQKEEIDIIKKKLSF